MRRFGKAAARAAGFNVIVAGKSAVRRSAGAALAVAMGAMTLGTASPAAAVELYRAGQGSIYGDPIAQGKGDIVIVHLDSTTLNATVGGTSTTTGNSSVISLISQQGLQSSVQSTTNWTHALAGDLATKVVDVTPEGLMHLRGTRRIQVAKTWQTLTIDGYIRPQDLAMDDTVQGSHLSDVTATVSGHLSTQQQFTLADALAILFGVGTLLKILP
jgi:flagellar basal body L-ring protein FlgH